MKRRPRIIHQGFELTIPVGFYLPLGKDTSLNFDLSFWALGRRPWPPDWRGRFPSPIVRNLHVGPIHLSRVVAL